MPEQTSAPRQPWQRHTAWPQTARHKATENKRVTRCQPNGLHGPSRTTTGPEVLRPPQQLGPQAAPTAKHQDQAQRGRETRERSPQKPGEHGQGSGPHAIPSVRSQPLRRRGTPTSLAGTPKAGWKGGSRRAAPPCTRSVIHGTEALDMPRDPPFAQWDEHFPPCPTQAERRPRLR